MSRAKIAATIAYTMREHGFTVAERERMAEAFANDMRLTGTPRLKFVNDCRTFGEQEALAAK